MDSSLNAKYKLYDKLIKPRVSRNKRDTLEAVLVYGLGLTLTIGTIAGSIYLGIKGEKEAKQTVEVVSYEPGE